MKTSRAANDNPIGLTSQVWQPRLGWDEESSAKAQISSQPDPGVAPDRRRVISALAFAGRERQVTLPRRLLAARARSSLRGDDFHETPRVAVESLLAVETFTGPIWEPACGLGAISTVLEQHRYTVVSTDLVERGFGTGRVDLLLEQHGLAPNIITNPPYKLADEFARKACDLTTGKVALLTRVAWLAGQKRHRTLFGTYPLARIWVFSRRLPMMHRIGYDGPKSASAVDHAWFVFDHTHIGSPTLNWLTW
jgi:hypothetical protein